jgi:hypothetical protein
MSPDQLTVEAQLVSDCVLESLTFTAGAWHGVIQGVYRRALGILWNGELISIVAPEMGAFPNALVAPISHIAKFLCDGQRISRVCEGLVVEGACRVLFDLRRAARWSPVLKPIVLIDGWDALGVRLKFALRQAAARVGAEGFGPLLAALSVKSVGLQSLPRLCRYAIGKIVPLLQALELSDAHELTEQVDALIGLGAGLTPSGDDLLVGMLAGLAVTADPGAGMLTCAIRAAPPNRTTALAQTLLRHACEFEFSSRLHQTIKAFFVADRHVLEKCVIDAIAWGESSGADSFLGVVLGLSVALGRRGLGCVPHRMLAATA